MSYPPEAMVYLAEPSSFAFKLSSFLTRLFAVASISFWFVVPLILQCFATSRACYSYKCSMVFKQTIGHLVIHGLLLFALMTEPSMAPCFSIKFTLPLSLGLRICLVCLPCLFVSCIVF